MKSRVKPESEQRPANLTNSSDMDQELAELIAEFPETKTVTVRRFNPSSDRWAHLGTVPKEVFSEDYTRRRWGSGLYQFYFRNGAGQLIRTISTMEIEGDPDKPTLAEAPATVSSPVPAGGDTLVTMLLKQAEDNKLLMIELIRSIADRPAAPQSDLVQTVAALAGLQNLIPKAATPLPERIIEKLFDGALSNTGGRPAGEPENQWIGLVRDILVEFKPAIRDAMQQPARAPQAAPPAAALPPAEEEPEEEVIDEEAAMQSQQFAIHWLKSKCQRGAVPAALVTTILDLIDVQQLDLLLDKPWAAVLVDLNDPELAAEPFKTWFETLFKELRAVRGKTNPEGTTGNEAHVNGNGTTGA